VVVNHPPLDAAPDVVLTVEVALTSKYILGMYL
jgi:hypothetical protein